MYAKIEDNIVVKVNSSLASFSKAAPSWDAAQRAANGIYEVVYDTSNKKDERFYNNGAETLTFADNVVTATYTPATGKKLDDTNEVDEDGAALLDEDGVQVVTLGLKSVEKKQIKNQAAGLLKDTDWYVVRNAEAGTVIPADVATFRADVRTKSGTMETAIDGAASIEALEALFAYTNSGTDAEPNYTRPLGEFPKL